MTELDLKEKNAADGAVCIAADRCTCPTCGVAQALLRAKLLARGVFKEDAARVFIQASTCGEGSYPFIASVRVDGREVFRIMREPSEVFAPDVMEDIIKALRRPM